MLRCSERQGYSIREVHISIFGSTHYWACRHCYGLTYQQRRSHGFDRYQDRADKIKSKLIRRVAKEIEGTPWYIPPMKPKGMHWRTYEGLIGNFKQASEQAYEMFYIALVNHLRSIDDLA